MKLILCSLLVLSVATAGVQGFFPLDVAMNLTLCLAQGGLNLVNTVDFLDLMDAVLTGCKKGSQKGVDKDTAVDIIAGILNPWAGLIGYVVRKEMAKPNTTQPPPAPTQEGREVAGFDWVRFFIGGSINPWTSRAAYEYMRGNEPVRTTPPDWRLVEVNSDLQRFFPLDVAMNLPFFLAQRAVNLVTDTVDFLDAVLTGCNKGVDRDTAVNIIAGILNPWAGLIGYVIRKQMAKPNTTQPPPAPTQEGREVAGFDWARFFIGGSINPWTSRAAYEYMKLNEPVRTTPPDWTEVPAGFGSDFGNAIIGGQINPWAGIGMFVKENQKSTPRPTTKPPAPTEDGRQVSVDKVTIVGVTDDPNRLVTVHSYRERMKNANTAACKLPIKEEHGLEMLNETLPLGQSVNSTTCQTYTCLRVFEGKEFDMALISEFYGCWYRGECYGMATPFRDERCYNRECQIVRSKSDNKVRDNVRFLSVVADCPTADGVCMPPGSKNFDCFLNDEYVSHCVCRRRGKMVFMDNMMRFGHRVPTIGGSGNGSFCFFPFTANGESHKACILGESTKDWCATTPNYEKDKEWGYCTETPRYRVTVNDDRCYFPFKYNGMLYHDCTTDGSKNGKAWCSTQYKYNAAKTGECEKIED